MRRRYGISTVAALATIAAVLTPAAAQAAFPGQNGKIAYATSVWDRDNDVIYDHEIMTANADGTGAVAVTSNDDRDIQPAWSPDGSKIAFASRRGGNWDVYVMNPDGSGEVRLTDDGGVDWTPEWSPDGTRIAFASDRDGSPFQTEVYVMNADGSAETRLTTDVAAVDDDPSWSPDGTEIAFWSSRAPDGVYLMNADGSGQGFVSRGRFPDWLPSGDRIALSMPDSPPPACAELSPSQNVWTVKPDGTAPLRLTNDDCGTDRTEVAWSPDGTRFLAKLTCSDFSVTECSIGEIVRHTSSGSFEQYVTNSTFDDDTSPDWQSLPINSYPRPKGATPTQVALVPAYAQCTAPNRTHGPPLAFGSCNPPAQTSDELTVGTADSNAKPTKSRGLVRYDALLGVPATPADEADVKLTVELSDVYEQGTLADYAGELRARTSLRITDKLNTPHPGGPGAGTVSDIELEAIVSCAPTADTTEGASCNLTTTFDSLVPGTVTEGRRSIWALGQAEVLDAAGDPFMRQGLFVP